ATQTGEAAALAAAASRGTSKSIGRSKNTPSPEDPASQSDRIAGGVNLGMARMPDAVRPRASTKRAALIGMLERPEGASVAEIGQRLGWLPHTVRAAMTGLRHAGREVTRSKDATGQSVYRLARAETAPDRCRPWPPDTRMPAGRRSRLLKLDIHELREEWRRLYKADVSPHLSRELVIRAVAYRMQEVALGGLRLEPQRQLRQIATELKQTGGAAKRFRPQLKP